MNKSTHTPTRFLLICLSIATVIFAFSITINTQSNANANDINAHEHHHGMMTGIVAAPVATTTIDIQGFAFSPNNVTVNVGDTIVWTNKDAAPHSILFNDGTFASAILNINQSTSQTFTQTGTFDYVCGIHPSMKGKITVVGAATATPQPTATATAQANSTPVATGTPLPPCLMTTATFGKENASVVTNATGKGVFVINTANNTLAYNLSFANLSATETVAHFHGFAALGSSAPPLITIPSGSPKIGVWQYTDAQEANILAGLAYVNVHSSNFPNGEIRAQLTNFVPCLQISLPVLLNNTK